jgi:hypothetical protein
VIEAYNNLRELIDEDGSLVVEALSNSFKATKNPKCAVNAVFNTFDKGYYKRFANQTAQEVHDEYLLSYQSTEKRRGQLNQLPLSKFESLGGKFIITCRHI